MTIRQRPREDGADFFEQAGYKMGRIIMNIGHCLKLASAAWFAAALAVTGAHAEVTHIVPQKHEVEDINLYSGIQYARVDGSTLLDTELKLDLLTPTSTQPVPVVVFVLGSGWRATSRERLLPQLTFLAQAGFAVASIDYRGSGEASFPEPQKDVMAAVRFLRANAKSFNIDPERIVLMGNSAGGHLAFGAALGSDSDLFSDPRWADTSSAVKALIGIYPALYFNPDQLVYIQHFSQGFGQPRTEVPDGGQPIDLLTDCDPPILILHGTDDQVVPLASSERFYAEASGMGHDVDLVVVQDIGHSFEEMFSVPEVKQQILEFLERTTK
jgi:acetyl esterase/lipase